MDSEFDRLLVSGNAILDGDLSVSLLSGFSLGENMTFDIIEVGGSYSGTLGGFSNGAQVGSFDGTDLFSAYGSNTISLSTFSPVPEPGALATVSLMGLGFCARRRRTA